MKSILYTILFIDEEFLIPEGDDEGIGLLVVRKAEYDDSPETEKKREDMLFVPSVFSSE